MTSAIPANFYLSELYYMFYKEDLFVYTISTTAVYVN